MRHKKLPPKKTFCPAEKRYLKILRHEILPPFCGILAVSIPNFPRSGLWTVLNFCLYKRPCYEGLTLSAPTRLCHSYFSVYSGRASVSSTHARWLPQRLPRTISARLSGFHAHSERAKVFEILGDGCGVYWVCAKAALSYTECALRPLQLTLSTRLRCMSVSQPDISSIEVVFFFQCFKSLTINILFNAVKRRVLPSTPNH